MNLKDKGIVEFLIILILFFLVSFIVQNNIEFFEGLIKKDLMGVIVYILFTQIAIVFAPLSSMPLIPLLSNLWGWQFTAIVNIFAWTLGSVIVFLISRKFGVKILKKFISLEKLYKLEEKLPKKNVFISLIFLRMIIPVDVLSYALGFFTKINFLTFFVTTIIGVIPAAILWSYAGSVKPLYQFFIFLVVWFLILIIFSINEILKNRNVKKL